MAVQVDIKADGTPVMVGGDTFVNVASAPTETADGSLGQMKFGANELADVHTEDNLETGVTSIVTPDNTKATTFKGVMRMIKSFLGLNIGGKGKITADGFNSFSGKSDASGYLINGVDLATIFARSATTPVSGSGTYVTDVNLTLANGILTLAKSKGTPYSDCVYGNYSNYSNYSDCNCGGGE